MVLTNRTFGVESRETPQHAWKFWAFSGEDSLEGVRAYVEYARKTYSGEFRIVQYVPL